MATEDKGKVKFFEDFGKRFGEVVSKIEMANIEAPDWILEKLNLYMPDGCASLWGLLVFCESKKLYFYVHASESMMGAMMRVAKQGEGPKEQYVCLSELDGFKLLERQKHWYDFLNPGSRFQVEAEFESEGKKILFTINLTRDSELIKK